MRNNFKNIAILLVIFLSIGLITGCGSNMNEAGNLETKVGRLEEKLSEDEEYDLVFEVNKELIQLKSSSKEAREELEEEEIYTIAYDKSSKTLKSYSLYDFEYVVDPEVEYAEEEPTVLGKKGNPIVMSKEAFDSEGLSLIDSFSYDFFNDSEDEDSEEAEDVLKETDEKETAEEEEDQEKEDQEDSPEKKEELDDEADDEMHDGNMDEILLFSNVEKDENGELMLDDGHQWTLVARTQKGDFILFDDYVSMGSVRFKALTKDDGFYIVMILDDAASLQIVEYHFESDTATFVPYKNYQTKGNVNMLH